MESSDRPEIVIVPSSGRRPSLEELSALQPGWTEDALAQLAAAADAVDHWLAGNPAEASRFFHDPAAVIAELADTGVLNLRVDDLLEILSSRVPAKAGKPQRARFTVESLLGSKGKYAEGEKGGR